MDRPRFTREKPWPVHQYSDEYEVKRIFDSGVAELLFPKEIYHLDMATVKADLIQWFRKRIEGQ